MGGFQRHERTERHFPWEQSIDHKRLSRAGNPDNPGAGSLERIIQQQLLFWQMERRRATGMSEVYTAHSMAWPKLHLQKARRVRRHNKRPSRHTTGNNRTWFCLPSVLWDYPILIRRTVAEAEALTLWPPGVKSQLTGKHSDAGKDWKHKEKGATADEMAKQHHWLSAQESEQSLGDSEGQGSLAHCSPWGRKSRTCLSDWTTTTL